MAEAGRRANKQGERRVNAVSCPVLCRSALKRSAMQTFIASRDALTDACQLIDLFGADAALEAAVRAEGARDRGNVLRFCHWRQIERVIVTLSSEEPVGTVH
jgi:hypothetical protein